MNEEVGFLDKKTSEGRKFAPRISRTLINDCKIYNIREMVKQVYELIGVRIKEKYYRVTGSGRHAGKKFYQLIVEVDNRPEVKTVQAFQDKVGLAGLIGQEQIWKDIEESNYADKRYLFYYYLEDRNYSLVGWKELSNLSTK